MQALSVTCKLLKVLKNSDGPPSLGWLESDYDSQIRSSNTENMADYDCDPMLTTSPSTAVSTSHAVRSSTIESMWEGWTQTSPRSHCALTEQLLGGGYSCSTSAKNGSSYQHDLLSSWLMSGYQTVGGLQQHQGGEEGSSLTTMYQDEFSRMNICPSTSSDYHEAVASPPAAGGDLDASHQLYDVMQTCTSSSVQNNSGDPNEVDGQSAQFLNTGPLHNDMDTAHNLEVNGKQKGLQQLNASTELNSRASSSSPPSGLNSYGQTMQQHLGGQFDGNNYWASTGSNGPVTSSSPPSVCSGGAGMRSSGQQGEDHQPNTSCDSIILDHQHRSSKKGHEGDDVLFHNSGTDLTTDQMLYTELHGLFGRSLDAPTHSTSGAADHHRQQLAAGNYGDGHSDHSNWTQFTVSPNLSGPSSHTGGFIGIQDILDRTMFDSSCPDSLSTPTLAATRRESEVSPPTAISTIHNFNSAAADLTHATVPYRSSSADLESPEMGLQRKRSLSRGTEQVGESGVINAEDSVKRSCIVRCLWEQNIAQLQLANSPSEQHRNLWQLQSQALFGRLPSNFVIGGSSSSNSGSIDMDTAVGPALNTNGRPRARRGSATDPQSVYARHRRERINDRLKVLQHLVPNGAKVDIVTMLEEAINYVKFLQLQVRLFSSDELWIYAPTTYIDGVDVSMGMHAGLLNQEA